MAQQFNNKRKQRPNYFAQEKQRGGETFLQYKSPDQIQRDAIRVFRDLAARNINPEVDGKYFLDPKFIQNILITATNKLNTHICNTKGVELLVAQNPQDSFAYSVLEENKKSVEAYTIIYNGLNNIMYYGDVNYIVTMADNLSRYRNNI